MYRSNSNNVKRTQRSSTEMIKLQDEMKRSGRTLLEVTEFQLSLLSEFHINFLEIALLRLTYNILSFNIKVKSSNVEAIVRQKYKSVNLSFLLQEDFDSRHQTTFTVANNTTRHRYNFYYARIALYFLFMLFIFLSYVFSLYDCA